LIIQTQLLELREKNYKLEDASKRQEKGLMHVLLVEVVAQSSAGDFFIIHVEY